MSNRKIYYIYSNYLPKMAVYDFQSHDGSYSIVMYHLEFYEFLFLLHAITAFYTISAFNPHLLHHINYFSSKSFE